MDKGNLKKKLKNASEHSSASEDLVVVGIGASAGGIQALEEFFANVPADSGAAYVVILHLSPDYKSHLAEILQTAARVPITQVKSRVHVEPNQVYVVPPNTSLSMVNGHIEVSPLKNFEERRAPIDIFFRTLAESHDSRAICVVLSGTGADGSMGLKRVKERGGAAFAQNPLEAEYADMPRRAISTALVDAVLPVAEIPQKILAYKSSFGKVAIPVEPQARPDEQQRALREIFAQLRVRTGHDFSNYKRATVLRRIERRLSVHQLSDLPAYAAFVKEQPNETQALLKDLLISATNFFRDKELFRTLEKKILPRIIKDKTASDRLRVWTAGCATGEEAYSLAMLLAEQTQDSLEAPKIQIFATDIDEAAIAAAREGFYTITDAADVSPERLQRFFNKEGKGYRVRRELREMILFTSHNVLKDPPFSQLDLATCRNLLIYLNREAQKCVMETLHFALNPGGFLFIGSSESVDGAGDLFVPVGREHQFFQSRHAVGSSSSAPRRAFSVPDLPPAMRFGQPSPRVSEVLSPKIAASESLSYSDLHQRLLEQYAPPSVVVNEEYDIVHLSERAGRYLQMTGGEPTNNLLKLVREELRLDLRTALYQAVRRQTNVEAKNLPVKTEDGAETVNIVVRPVLRADDTARGFLLVMFEKNAATTDAPAETVFKSPEPVVRQLEEELSRTKLRLRSSVEQYEVQTEELKASNEELQAMNEELRSAAEELETGKEELQSVNEELLTANQELKIKVEEISQSSNDFQNLMNSTAIATIFLDPDLRVKMFTPEVQKIFNLIPSDLGRSLSDITGKLDYENLMADVKAVMETLQTLEREMQTADGRWFLTRILPYRTSEDRIRGVVLTLLDISVRKRQEKQMREMTLQLKRQTDVYNATLSSVTDFIYAFDREGQFQYANQPLLNLLGLETNDEIVGKTFFDLPYPTDLAAKLHDQIGQVIETGKNLADETPYVNPAGESGFYEYIFSPVFGEGGAVESVAGLTRDITEHKRAEEALRESRERLQMAMEAGEVFSWELNLADGSVFWSSNTEKILGFAVSGDIEEAKEMVHAGDREKLANAVARAVKTGANFEVEFRMINPADGTKIWLHSQGVMDKSEPNEPPRLTGITQNITERRLLEEQTRTQFEELETIYRTAPIGLALIDREFRFVRINQHLAEINGIPAETHIGRAVGEIVPDLAAQMEKVFRQVFETGAPVFDVELEGETAAQPGVRRVWNENWYPLKNAAGETFAINVAVEEITERRRAETNAEFLSAITADLARLPTMKQVLDTVGAKIGTYFNLSSCIFSVVNVAADEIIIAHEWVAPKGRQNIVGTYRISEFLADEYVPLARAGETLVVPDVYADGRTIGDRYAALGIGSFVKVPLVRDGEWRFSKTYSDARPRNWRADEIELMRELTTRIWARLERARAEAALSESEERLQLAASVTGFGVHDYNHTDKKLYWSPELKAMHGLAADAEVSINSVTDYILAEDRERLARAIEAALDPAGSGEFEQEFRIVRPDNGETRWLYNKSQTTFANQGAKRVAVRNTGIVVDITDRRNAEQDLRESEERLQTLIEGARDHAIIAVSPQGAIESWNAGAERMFGWTEGEIVGSQSAVLFTPEDRAKSVPEREIKTAARRGVAEDERWHVRKDGSRFYASGVMRALRSSNGELLGFVKIARDMTEKIAAEKAVRDRETLQKLVGAQEDERQRIARDIHDHLGQQLTALRMKLEAAKKACGDRELCARIDDTLAVARRIDADVDFIAWELRPAALDDFGLPATLENYIQEWSRHTGVVAEFQTAGLKEMRFAAETETNLYRIAQEVLNNIYKHARARRVELIIEKRRNEIVLIIGDDGEGFDTEDKNVVKKGIGLIGMRERAALLGGTVEIESQKGLGTTVFVRVPLKLE